MATTISKWKDPEFLRAYHREQWRRRSALKRHPNILEDGSKWSERHPYGKYSSKEEMYQNHRSKYYTPAPKELCSCCGVEYYVSVKDKHMNSKRHKIAYDAVSKYQASALV
jgi:hypothetical protein